MKPKKKKKLDIKGFFVSHVEKIILVLIIPLSIYFAYQGTQYEPLSWQPDALAKSAEDSDQFIKNNVRSALDEGVEVFHYDQYADWIKQEIRVDLYKTEVQWLPSLFPEKNKRGEVPVYTVIDLKTSSGLGSVAVDPTSAAAIHAGLAPNLGESLDGGLSGPGGGGGARIGARWAVVTGLIPIQKQLNIYVETFTDSVLPDPIRDMPSYVTYDVERAVIEPGQAIEDLKWEKQELVKGLDMNLDLWSGVGQDVVDPNFMAPRVKIPMAYPLPPISKRFGEEVAHPPAVPMLTDSQTELLQQLEEYQKKVIDKRFDYKDEEILDGNLFGGREGSFEGMSSGGANDGSRGARGPGRMTQKDEEEILKPVEVSNYLFRYLDFKVEPGKTYRYRVRLYLANPNYNLAPNYLEQESLASERVLITEYSEPSNMVTIPLESRILTTGITQPSLSWADPLTNVTAIYFDMKDGSEWYVEKNAMTRGSLVNIKRQEVTNAVMEQKAKATELDSSMAPTPPSRPSRRTTKKPEPKKDDESKKTINIVSEVCILDIVGGARLPKATSREAIDAPDLTSPGKVLVLEPSGNMLIRNINLDRIEMENIKNPKQGSIFGGGGMGEGFMMDSGM